MSLTRELDDRNSPVRRFFEAYFPDLRAPRRDWAEQIQGALTIRPATDRRLPSTIGTAFDYRLRYFFAATPASELVAAHGMNALAQAALLREFVGDDRDDTLASLVRGFPPEGTTAAYLVDDLVQSLDATVARLTPAGRRLAPADEQTLCRYCYVLALYEELFRAGLAINSPLYSLHPDATLGELLALPDPLWIEDLCALAGVFFDGFAELTTVPAILNPKFAGSRDIGGADADLIVDGCLIELKTTIRPQLRKELLYQLLGYVLLDYDDEYEIDAAAVYLSRQATLVHWDLQVLLGALLETDELSLPALREEFRSAVRAVREPSG